MGGFAGIDSIKTHLKRSYGINGVLDIDFLLMEDIWHDVKKGSGYIIISISCQTFAVSPAINYLVDMCTNLWCNNYKTKLGATFLGLIFSFLFTKIACLLCTLCEKIANFLFLLLNYNVQKLLWNKQVCPKWNNVKIKNNLSHISGNLL